MSSEHEYGMSRMAASYTKSLRGWSYGTNTTPQPRARPMPPTIQPSHTAHMLKAPSARLFCGISSPGSRSCCWAPGWPILVELGPSESPQCVLLPWVYARCTARSGSVVRSDGRCRRFRARDTTVSQNGLVRGYPAHQETRHFQHILHTFVISDTHTASFHQTDPVSLGMLDGTLGTTSGLVIFVRRQAGGLRR